MEELARTEVDIFGKPAIKRWFIPFSLEELSSSDFWGFFRSFSVDVTNASENIEQKAAWRPVTIFQWLLFYILCLSLSLLNYVLLKEAQALLGWRQLETLWNAHNSIRKGVNIRMSTADWN